MSETVIQQIALTIQQAPQLGLTINRPVAPSMTIGMTMPGVKGDKGDAATIAVRNVTTGDPNTPASVTNAGTTSSALLDFVIPRGADGVDGEDGDPLTFATIQETKTGTATDKAVTPSGLANVISFVYTQGSPSDTWVIPHGLNRYPNAIVIDSAGSVVEGSPFYDSLDVMTISFKGGFSGKAYLN